MKTYKIIRMYADEGKPNEVVATGMTLEVAQAHCKSPETTSFKCTNRDGLERTRKYGAWFDGYEED